MEKDTEHTEVVFRKWKGEIIALFPYRFDDYRALTCLSYMHVGHHSNADYNHIVYHSKLATEEEYKELFQELESIGYLLKPIQKINSKKWRIEREKYLIKLKNL